jgi:TolB protein
VTFWSNRDGNMEIYVMNIDGSGQTRLTNDPASDSNPGWSPDGTMIVFHSERDGNREIYVMNADGSQPRRLTKDPSEDVAPDWGPGR